MKGMVTHQLAVTHVTCHVPLIPTSSLFYKGCSFTFILKPDREREREREREGEGERE